MCKPQHKIKAAIDARDTSLALSSDCAAAVEKRADAFDRHYVVSWTIDVDAQTPLEAAIAAKRIQQRVASIANVFDVVDDRGQRACIDLDDERPPR